MPKGASCIVDRTYAGCKMSNGNFDCRVLIVDASSFITP